MNERTVPRLSKMPFVVADVVLLVLAGWIVLKHPGPLSAGPLALVAACVALAFIFGVAPFVLEYQAAVKFAEGDRLTDAVAQIGRVEVAAEQIRHATSLWQDVQAQSAKTAAAASAVAGRMTEEAKVFAEFMQQANDTEKGTLRLEVEKLRRAEGDWLQVLVRILDHVFAIHQAAARSGQANVTEQLKHFQNACRDTARRIGLVPFEVAAGEPFDAEKHQILEPPENLPADALVAETIAAGYSFQGRILRPPLVRVQDGAVTPVTGEQTPVKAAPAEGIDQNELELTIEGEEETPAGLS